MVRQIITSFRLIAALCLLPLITSCGGGGGDRRIGDSIEETWQLCETALPQAAARAEALRDSVKGASEHVRQYYDLLCIRLRDKNMVIPSSPDSAQRTVAYFSRHGSDTDRERACYYLGSAYRDLKDYPRAVRYFQEAVDIAAQSGRTDTSVWQNALSQLSYLHMMVLNYEEELHAALQAVELASHSPSGGGEKGRGNEASQNLPIYLAEAASAYRHLGDTLRCLQSLDEVYRMAQREHFPPRYGGVMAFMLKMYSDYHNHEMLDTLLRQLLLLPEEHRPQNYELCLARSYDLRADAADRAPDSQSLTDSAIVHYLTYYNNAGTLSGRYEASAGLQRCHLRRGNLRQAAEWGCRLYDLNDSIIAGREFEQTQRARDAYVYYRDRKREQAIHERDSRIVSTAVIVCLALLSIMLGGTAYHYYRKKKLMQEVFDMSQVLRSIREELRRSSAELSLREQANHELTRMALLVGAESNAGDIMEHFDRVAHGMEHLRDGSWRELMTAIEGIHPGFLDAVQMRLGGQLREPLLYTICLLKIGMRPAQIAQVMDASKQTVWNRVKRAETTCGDLIGEVHTPAP